MKIKKKNGVLLTLGCFAFSAVVVGGTLYAQAQDDVASVADIVIDVAL